MQMSFYSNAKHIPPDTVCYWLKRELFPSPPHVEWNHFVVALILFKVIPGHKIRLIQQECKSESVILYRYGDV